jgi:chitin disaccharide deacetylase
VKVATPRLLIVNADDWGANAATSNAIRECWEARAVTSTSGMVFMADSKRAAQLAIGRDCRLDFTST